MYIIHNKCLKTNHNMSDITHNVSFPVKAFNNFLMRTTYYAHITQTTYYADIIYYLRDEGWMQCIIWYLTNGYLIAWLLIYSHLYTLQPMQPVTNFCNTENNITNQVIMISYNIRNANSYVYVLIISLSLILCSDSWI